jgi:DNA-nicking Smr family endonuclease
MIRNTILPVFFLLLGVLLNQNALSGTVYQWTDETGNINFSDVPPDESITAEKHEYNVEQNEESAIDLEQYSIINQAEKMAQWRRQLADERLAKRKLYLEEKRLAHEMELELSRQNQSTAAAVICS